MTEERFRKYLAFKALDQVGGADTLDLANDLAREWDGAVYVRVDVADSANAALQRRNDTQAESIMEFQAEEKSLRSRLAQVEKEQYEECVTCARGRPSWHRKGDESL